MNSVFFVSSNYTWGGSEILWSEAALKMLSEGFHVRFAVRYNREIIETLKSRGGQYLNLNKGTMPLSLSQRALGKLKLKKYDHREAFLKTVSDDRPQLVVISQGNNVDANYFMNVCRLQSIPYITVTQLVTEILWLSLNDTVIDELRINYSSAKKNYFVSQANLSLHELMLGEKQPNSEVIHNPFTVPLNVIETYQIPKDERFHIALVARLDTFHKGHDLLLCVLSQQKWKERPVIFHFYGSGPHEHLIRRLIKIHDLENVVIEGHVTQVETIWRKNQMLILPSRMEGQALALIEALWCYRAAIVTDVGGASELITEGENGFIAASPTIIDIDQALERAWQQRERWQELGRNAGVKIRNVFTQLPIEAFVSEVKKALKESTLLV